MEALTHAASQRLLEFLRLLYTPCSLDEFPVQVLSALSALVGAEVFAYTSFSVRNPLAPNHYSFPLIEPGAVATSITVQRQIFLDHPITQNFLTASDPKKAFAISDAFSEQELHRLFAYTEFMQNFGLEDQMGIFIDLPLRQETNAFHQGQECLGLTLSRDRRNFTERDRLLLNLIRPHVKQAYESVAAFTHLHQQLTQQRQATEQAALIVLSLDGTVRWITRRAGELLHCYFPPSKTHIPLPDLLQRWVKQQCLERTQTTQITSPPKPLCIEQHGHRLTVRFNYDAVVEQITLLLEETQPERFSPQSLELLGLTKREAEVLFWVAKDQSTQAIAKRLSMSDRTVKKHLEHIYEKFGVQTRVAAVMFALQHLGIVSP